MDAIEFVKQLRRMNEQGVPKNRFIYPCAVQETDSPEEVVAEVEEWAKEHPAKTRQSVFLEQYPDAAIPVGGAIGNGKVIGEFTCDRIYELETKAHGGSYYVKGEGQSTTNEVARQSCLTLKDMHAYLKAAKGYGWHIFDLRIYDTPRELSEFQRATDPCDSCHAEYTLECTDCKKLGGDIKRPPQSWCYVEEG